MGDQRSDQVDDRPDFKDLKALYINCTLKKSPEPSHTQLLMDKSIAIMRSEGVEVEVLRAVDHDIAVGVWPDMTEHGWASDAWPAIFEKVLAANILVIGTPIWLGEKSSVCTHVIERLYGNSSLLNDAGQYAYYGRTGGCIVTGNEDGIKHCSMSVLYGLQHLGYVVPPQARRGLDRRGRARSLLRRRWRGPRQRLHEPQHDFHGLQPDAHRAHAEGQRRLPGLREPALGVGRRLPLGPRQPRTPLEDEPASHEADRDRACDHEHRDQIDDMTDRREADLSRS